MIGPVLMHYGTPKQQSFFLPKILNSDHWWCQGYSEPGSGSDLASLKTKAILKGDKYIINGTKTWTTLAQYADWMFCLVRTSFEGKPQEGISFIMIDMKTKGITVDPIITLDGAHEINTVYLEDVEVPRENIIFEENKGWTVAKFLLSHERTSIAAVGKSISAVKKLKQIANIELNNEGSLLITDKRFRDRLTTLEMDLKALEFTELRILSEENKGVAPGPEASLLKIRGSEIQQRITELTMNAVGYYGISNDLARSNEDRINSNQMRPDYSQNTAASYLNMRKTTIYGGSNEIQKNILSKMVLGL
jgi:alkylation response protein AidB-like acyl-CoA dehydrogenase